MGGTGYAFGAAAILGRRTGKSRVNGWVLAGNRRDRSVIPRLTLLASGCDRWCTLVVEMSLLSACRIGRFFKSDLLGLSAYMFGLSLHCPICFRGPRAGCVNWWGTLGDVKTVKILWDSTVPVLTCWSGGVWFVGSRWGVDHHGTRLTTHRALRAGNWIEAFDSR